MALPLAGNGVSARWLTALPCAYRRRYSPDHRCPKETNRSGEANLARSSAPSTPARRIHLEFALCISILEPSTRYCNTGARRTIASRLGPLSGHRIGDTMADAATSFGFQLCSRGSEQYVLRGLVGICCVEDHFARK
ncbi:hypothetical protein MRB53_041892 [Persea americana]|nr:hypothetical protein MRB53_041892 [Persea americana]